MHTLQMAWGAMAYADISGDDTPLLFLHGTGCDSADWHDVLARLTTRSRVLAMDFRGHGESATPEEPFTLGDLADDAVAMLDRLAITDAIVVGHSLGGMVAMAAAANSSRIAALVLLEGWTKLGAARALAGERFYGRLTADAINGIQAKARRTHQRFDAANWEHFWSSVSTFDAWPFLAATTRPITEVFGSLGRTETTASNLAIPDNPCIQIRWIDNAGHYLPHEAPAAVAEICLEVKNDLSG